MRKVYYLPHCKTCQRILKELNISEETGFVMQNTKEKHISAKELDKLKKQVGSYEALFNRRSMKYRSMGLKDKVISEQEYRQFILDEYTFLKRPMLVIDGEVFIATTKKEIAAASAKLSTLQ